MPSQCTHAKFSAKIQKSSKVTNIIATIMHHSPVLLFSVIQNLHHVLLSCTTPFFLSSTVFNIDKLDLEIMHVHRITRATSLDKRE